jgi:hypothetical protein
MWQRRKATFAKSVAIQPRRHWPSPLDIRKPAVPRHIPIEAVLSKHRADMLRQALGLHCAQHFIVPSIISI